MPALKSDIYITIRVGDKSLSIGAVELTNGRFAIKTGRSWAKKIPLATMTEIFETGRKWAVRNMRKSMPRVSAM